MVAIQGGVRVKIAASRTGLFLIQMPDPLEVLIPHVFRVLGVRTNARVAIIHINGGIGFLGKGVDSHPGHQCSVGAVIGLDLVGEGLAVRVPEYDVPAIGAFDPPVDGIRGGGLEPVAGEADQHGKAGSSQGAGVIKTDQCMIDGDGLPVGITAAAAEKVGDARGTASSDSS